MVQQVKVLVGKCTTQGSRGGKKEPTPASFYLTATCMYMYVYVYLYV